MIGWLVMIWLAGGLVGCRRSTMSSVNESDMDSAATGKAICVSPASAQSRELHRLTNQLRQSKGAGALTYSAQLQSAAQAYAEVLAGGAKLSHIGPLGDTVFDRVAATGYPGTKIGENLGGGQSSAQTVLESWQGSRTHSINLVSPSFSQMGVGYAEGEGAYGKYWVQLFGNGECD